MHHCVTFKKKCVPILNWTSVCLLCKKFCMAIITFFAYNFCIYLLTTRFFCHQTMSNTVLSRFFDTRQHQPLQIVALLLRFYHQTTSTSLVYNVMLPRFFDTGQCRPLQIGALLLLFCHQTMLCWQGFCHWASSTILD